MPRKPYSNPRFRAQPLTGALGCGTAAILCGNDHEGPQPSHQTLEKPHNRRCARATLCGPGKILRRLAANVVFNRN